MPTRSSSSTAAFRATSLLIPRWRRSTSVTCSPTGITGLSEQSGSWKTIDRSRPRRSRICGSDSVSRSVPSISTLPLTRTPRSGSSRMIAIDVTDLPQPDSPTSPTTCPGATSKLTPSTATVAGSPLRWNATRRSRTASSGSVVAAPLLRVSSARCAAVIGAPSGRWPRAATRRAA